MFTRFGVYDHSLPESEQSEAYYKLKPILEHHLPNAEKVVVKVLQLLIDTVQKNLSEVEKRQNK